MPETAAPSLTHFYIIDDDISFCESLKMLLNAHGLAADYFGSARSFLDSVSPNQHGLAIIDVHMPECDGFGLVETMTRFHYDMPFIMISGHGQKDARDLAMQKGAVGFLQKPFSSGSLQELFDKARKKGARL